MGYLTLQIQNTNNDTNNVLALIPATEADPKKQTLPLTNSTTNTANETQPESKLKQQIKAPNEKKKLHIYFHATVVKPVTL